MSRFAFLALASTVVIWTLVVVGGIVRVTGSGMGCGPDWPLCNGAVIPLFDLETFIEWFHRLAAAAGSLLVLATVFIAARSHRDDRWIFWPAIGIGVALLAQIGLGAVTVKLHLAFEVVTVHLGVAAIILALLVVMTTRALSHGRRIWVDHGDGVVRLTLATIVSSFGLLLIGAYMMGSGASLGCTEIPFCNGGEILPQNAAGQSHMLHRYAAVFVGLLLAVTIAQARRARPGDRSVAVTANVAAGLYLIQFIAGVANVVFFLPPVLRVAHLALAFALWAALVALYMLAHSRPVLTSARDERRPATVGRQRHVIQRGASARERSVVG
jgi:heme A synthase